MYVDDSGGQWVVSEAGRQESSLCTPKSSLACLGVSQEGCVRHLLPGVSFGHVAQHKLHCSLHVIEARHHRTLMSRLDVYRAFDLGR